MQLTINGFQGMDNVSGGGMAEGAVIPGLVINATQDATGKLLKRQGCELAMSLADCHSMFTGRNGTFCVGGSSLYKLNMVAFTKGSSLATIPGGKVPLYYVEIGDLVFMSNINWIGVYERGTVRTWGQIIDDLDAMNWVREENGSMYFLANSDGTPSAVLKPHDFVHKPSPMKYITFGHGRIWGARGNRVFYSDELSPEWWQDDVNFFEFQKDVVLIAAARDGMYVGTEDQTVFLAGTDPRQMAFMPHDIGAIENTMQYCSAFNELGNNTALWATPRNGIVAGLPGGNLAEITAGRIRYDAEAGISSFFRRLNGQPQYGFVVTYPDAVTNGDQATKDWIDEIYTQIERGA